MGNNTERRYIVPVEGSAGGLCKIPTIYTFNPRID